MIKKTKNIKDYKFSDSLDTACFVCDHILNLERPILFVTHDKDLYWQFICGYPEHDESNIKVISLQEATEIDNSLNELSEMPLGFYAEREKHSGIWNVFKTINEED